MASAAFDSTPAPNDLLPPEDKRFFQHKFADQAVRSYLFLSIGMGVIAFLLPILLILFGGYSGHYSISAFYHVTPGASRDILVGSLCATGVFLFLFHGLSNLENWLLNFAGVAAVSVAMNPMPAEQCARSGLTLHFASAIIFFVLLAIVAVGLSKGRVKYIVDQTRKRQFTIAYNAAGVAMIAMPALVAAIHFLTRQECETHWIFWTECGGIWSFAAYWFVKTLEYRVLLKVR